MAITAIVAGATYAYGTYKSVEAQKEGQKATERAQQASQQQYAAEAKKAEIQNLRSVRQQIRGARIAQSTMQNIGAQAGGVGSSAMAGGIASIGSQLGSNLGYMSEIATANTAIGTAALNYSTAMGEASIAGSRASQYGAIAGLGGTVFQAVGGIKTIQG